MKNKLELQIIAPPEPMTVERFMDEHKIGESLAKRLVKTFSSFAEELSPCEENYLSVAQEAGKGIDEDLMAKARATRLGLRKVRIAVEKTRKQEKDYYLSAGRAIDAIAKVVIEQIGGREEHMAAVEEFEERQLKAQYERLHAERKGMLAEIGKTDISLPLGQMSVEDWDVFFEGQKAVIERKKREAKEAEEKRRAEMAERVKLEEENRKLREAEEKRKAEQARIERERAALERKEAEAPDREKLLLYVQRLQAVDVPEVQTEGGQMIIKAVSVKVSEIARIVTQFCRESVEVVEE